MCAILKKISTSTIQAPGSPSFVMIKLKSGGGRCVRGVLPFRSDFDAEGNSGVVCVFSDEFLVTFLELVKMLKAFVEKTWIMFLNVVCVADHFIPPLSFYLAVGSSPLPPVKSLPWYTDFVNGIPGIRGRNEMRK